MWIEFIRIHMLKDKSSHIWIEFINIRVKGLDCHHWMDFKKSL
jgi:hypothetical protein